MASFSVGQPASKCLRLEIGMRTAVFYFPIIFSLCRAGESRAQTRTDIAAGHQNVERICARCHVIGLHGQSAHPDAPPFRQIAAKGNVENLEEALGEGIVVGHPDMPQFKFKPEEVGALIAYLMSLSAEDEVTVFPGIPSCYPDVPFTM
jgi:cytochrome c